MTIDLHPHIACPRPSASGAPRHPGGRLRTPGRLKGWAAASALAVPLAAVPVVLTPTPLPAQSAAPVRPSPPHPLPVTVGDTEALLTWTAGGPGIGGTCATTSYDVDIFEPNGGLVATSTPMDAPTSGSLRWFVDGLAPATAYRGEITAYGVACDEYATGTVALTTTGASASSDPTAPAGNAKQLPFPVRTLRNQVSGTSATVTWDAPRRRQPPPVPHEYASSVWLVSLRRNRRQDHQGTRNKRGRPENPDVQRADAGRQVCLPRVRLLGRVQRLLGVLQGGVDAAAPLSSTFSVLQPPQPPPVLTRSPRRCSITPACESARPYQPGYSRTRHRRCPACRRDEAAGGAQRRGTWRPHHDQGMDGERRWKTRKQHTPDRSGRAQSIREPVGRIKEFASQ